MQPHVSLEIGVDLELGMADVTNIGAVPSVGAEVDHQLAGVAAGIGANLTPEGGTIKI